VTGELGGGGTEYSVNGNWSSKNAGLEALTRIIGCKFSHNKISDRAAAFPRIRFSFLKR
jgi:hypothetical protein